MPAIAGFWHYSLFAQSINPFKRKIKNVPTQTQPVYIGSVTGKPGEGIYLAYFNPTTGQLTDPTLAAEAHNPSYLTLARLGSRHVLYAANEGDEHSSGVSSYLIDPKTSALTGLNKVPCGTGPCYVSVNASASAAFCANYMGSSVNSFQVKTDGSLSPMVEQLNFKLAEFGHHGPNAARQDASHPHSASISPDNRFLIVNDLGNDNIVTLSIHPDTAKLGPPRLNECKRKGSGPRHLTFHPNKRWAYGVNELTSTVQHYLWNTTDGIAGSGPLALLTWAGDEVSTLAAGFHGMNTAAEILVSPDGQYMVVSNRGENSLVVFKIDTTSGALSFVQRVPCGGKIPRQFTLDSTGNWLLCGNSGSDSITVFAREQASGKLSGPVQTLAINGPQMILFA